MNPFILFFIALPTLEVFLMIKIGGEIGALNTIALIFITAITGIYFAKMQGIQTLRSGMINLYQNKLPLYEMISGASIALAAALLILPGFISDTLGFLLLLPFTRKLIISFWFRNKYKTNSQNDEEIIDAEIIEEEKNKDEL